MDMMQPVSDWDEYQNACLQAATDPVSFWEKQASTFRWMRRWVNVMEPDMLQGYNRWYTGGKLNITVNCLDRHLEHQGDHIALLWEPNEPDQLNRRISYRELYTEVCRLANALRSLGIRKGDRICFYMPMIPELVIGMLACARIGAVHSVVFAGFSAISLADRIQDSSCRLVICADHNVRGAKHIPVKAVVDEALALGCDSIQNVIVYKTDGPAISWMDGRDIWWHDLMRDQPGECQPEMMDSEDMLFILYTSGSTGKPKGVVHTCGGYMVYAEYSFRNVFQYRPGEIYWCTADIGWITGHSYIVYAPLLSGATSLMFEGIPTYPSPSRFWQVCEKHKVNIFYTAPTAIRALMAAGDAYTEGFDLSSLRVLGTVGEPINAEAWHWYHDRIGEGKMALVDTWWQTETGGILISPLADVTDQEPCHASYPLPGIEPVLLDSDGHIILQNEVEGFLCIQSPWPSMIRTTYGDHERCYSTYFSRFPGYYFTGDGAKRDANGRYRILGRVDDVINVSGHRLGTAEIENAINAHPDIVESAVVGFPHDIKGQGIYAYVIASGTSKDELGFLKEINAILSSQIGPIAKVDQLMVVTGLPKTRSGKIMRRILRKIAERDAEHLGDITTLLNPEIVSEILQKAQLT
jgi:acetyl-CoA synthetase